MSRVYTSSLIASVVILASCSVIPIVVAVADESADASQTVKTTGVGTVQDGRAYIAFDGDNVRLHYEYLPAPTAISPFFSSVLHETHSESIATDHPGVQSRHVWDMFDSGILVTVQAQWRDADTSDYLAWGWWIGKEHVESWKSGENNEVSHTHSHTYIGSFLDGPDFPRGTEWPSDFIPLPIDGQAIYSGHAAGLYKSDTVTGEFNGEASLTANFATGTIGGCVGCAPLDGIWITPVDYNTTAGSYVRQDDDKFKADFTFLLGTASFMGSPHYLGSFAGLLTVQGAGEGWHGNWNGQFSRHADAHGNPRLVGALLSGSRGEWPSISPAFSGALIANSPAYRDSLDAALVGTGVSR